MVFDTGQVLATTSTYIDNTMFLGVVAFAGDVCRDDVPVGEPDSTGLTLGRIGFLGFQHHYSQHDTFTDRTALQIGRHRHFLALRWLCSTFDLV